jgi:biotin carboxyl carrier protein
MKQPFYSEWWLFLDSIFALSDEEGQIRTRTSAASQMPVPVLPPAAGDGCIGADVIAPMPEEVIVINANLGDVVKKGQELIGVEAMKMHNPILACYDGTVQKVFRKDRRSNPDNDAVIGDSSKIVKNI